MTEHPKKTNKVLFTGLTVLLAAFSVWCVVLLWRSYELRRDLGHHLGWIEDLRRLRGDLDRASLGPPGDAAGHLVYNPPAHMFDQSGGPELQVAVQGLRGALDRLRTGLEAQASALFRR